MTTLTFPDVEALVVAYLESRVEARVATRVPDPRPSTFVRVTRVGGGRRDLVTDLPMVLVEAWAPDGPAAQHLGQLCRDAVFDLEQTSHGGAWVRNVSEIGGLQAFPDPLTDNPRYQFTVQLQIRGVPAS